jgi:signal transduction histidine kinase
VGSSRARSGQRWAALVFLLGMTASVLIWQALRTRELEVREAEFDVLAQECIDVVEMSLHNHLEAVYATADYIAAVPQIHRSSFHKFTAPLLARHAPIQALEWIPKVPRASRDQHEAEAAAEGLVDYHILEAGKSQSLGVAEMRQEYFPVFYVEPLERNRSALGFDLASESVRRDALMSARDSGVLTLTGRVMLVQETADLFGVLAFLPVYVSEEGPANLLGFALGVLRVGEVVEDALRQMDPRILRVVVEDISAPEGERFLYARGGSSGDREEATDEELEGSGHHDLDLGGRTWCVRCQPTATYLAQRRGWDQIATLAGGSTVSVLLAALIVILSGRTARVEQEVAHRTAELQQANRKLEEEITAGESTRKKLRTMTSEVFLAEEKERGKLAVDLHDDLGQLVPLVKLRLSALRDDPAAAGVEDKLREIGTLVDRAGDSLRSLTFQTMPPILHDLGLRPAIEWLLEDVWLRMGVHADFRGGSRIGELSEDVRTIAYRSIRELITNAIKHAEAERISVTIDREESTLQIVVEDDGRGFDPETVTGADGMGFGLFSIRERLDHLGGRLVIESSPGSGTRAVMVLPVDPPETCESPTRAPVRGS